MNYVDQIEEMGACPDAVQWLREANHPTPEAAWAACPRADWMLWLLGACANRVIVGNPRDIAIIAADLAESVLHYIPAGENRPRIAIETIRRWARGEATMEEVRSVDRALQSIVPLVYDATFTAAAADAIDAANYAVDAANAAVCATIYADKAETARSEIAFAVATAAHTADYAALAHTRAAAYDALSADYADTVRRHFPNPPELIRVSK